MAEQIEIIIAKDGSTTVEGLGFSGPACDLVLRELAEALGSVEEVKHKPEFDQAMTQHRRTVGR